jgi:hypothetical protein
VSPGDASRRTSASAIGPKRGDTQAEQDLGAPLDRLGESQPPQVAVRLAAPVKPGDGLLPDVAALLEVDRALVDAGLLRHGLGVHVDAQPRAAGLDAQALGRLL